MTNYSTETTQLQDVQAKHEELMTKLETLHLHTNDDTSYGSITVTLSELKDGCPGKVVSWLANLPISKRVQVLNWAGNCVLSDWAREVIDMLEIPNKIGLTDTDHIVATLMRADDLYTDDAEEVEHDRANNFVGIYSTWEEYAREVANELYGDMMEEAPRYFEFDHEQFALDLKFDYSVYELPRSGVVIYTNN